MRCRARTSYPASSGGSTSWYGTASRAFLINRLLPPLEVEDEDGFCVFYVEEQAVYLWGFATEDRDADDPPVWCRENLLGKPWVREAPSVSVFLLKMVAMSAALNGPHGAAAAWLSPEETALALSPPLVEVDLPPWHWPGHPTRWYAGEDAVAFSCSNVGLGHDSLPALSVWAGSLTDGGIRFISCISRTPGSTTPRGTARTEVVPTRRPMYGDPLHTCVGFKQADGDAPSGGQPACASTVSGPGTTKDATASVSGNSCVYLSAWRRWESNPRPRSREDGVYERSRRSGLVSRSPRRLGCGRPAS